MFVSHPPKFLQRLYASLTWEVNTENQELYLTFDDGPTPGVTEGILACLKEYDAKATFFCLGKNVKAHPDLYARILAEGHRVGNHSYHHLNGWKTNSSLYVKDVMQASELIDSKLFRPPYGKMKSAQIKRLKKHFELIMWSTLSRDYDAKLSKEQCLKISLKEIKPGAILVFHDSLKAQEKMDYVLREVLEYSHALKYQFKALP